MSPLPTEAGFREFSRDDEVPQTYDMVCQACAVGVFQIERSAQMSILPRLQPRSFYDMVIDARIVRPVK